MMDDYIMAVPRKGSVRVVNCVRQKKGNSTNHLGDCGQSNYVIAVQPTQDLSRVKVVVCAKFQKNSSDISLTTLI